MSTLRDRNVIDMMMVEDDKFILVIVDDMEWTYESRRQHAGLLQDKLNDYLTYIGSGQAEEARPGLRPVIRIDAEYPYSRYCIDFLTRVRDFIKNKDDICDIEWVHTAAGDYDDGFSDDMVFDREKVFPRLKKNWAKDPLNEVSLMETAPDTADYPQDMIMTRVMDSFIGMFMLDTGKAFTYLTYDNIPGDVDVNELGSLAFDNLVRDIKYRITESKEPGIFGIVCGGDFEAESILLDDIWKEVSDMLGDDVVIMIPTKDIVTCTRAGDKKLVKKMKKMSQEMFRMNKEKTPHLLFCRDIFLYRRGSGVEVIGEYDV